VRNHKSQRTLLSCLLVVSLVALEKPRPLKTQNRQAM
jgi:hypothetical protein